MSEFTVGPFVVGAGRVLVIAEAGVNHDGDVDKACALVDAAADAGADVVKFQTFSADRLVTTRAPKAAYQETASAESQHQMLRRLELDRAAHQRLVARAAERRIVLLSTPFDVESARLLVELGLPALKLGSGELTDTPLLRAVARHGVPLLISTGMADMVDVDRAVAAVRGVAPTLPLALLHCVSTYPADASDVNLRAIETLRARFGVPVGFSDHTEGSAVVIAAVARGAAVVEKHFTLDRATPGPDHAFSLEPAELAALVRSVREVEACLGDGVKVPRARELPIARVARKSVTVARAVAAGAVLVADDLAVRRPGTGLPPWRIDDVPGRRARRDLTPGDVLVDEDLQ